MSQSPRPRNPYPTTDLIIEYNDGHKDGIILITRKNHPRGLALPGGFAEYGISLEENAVKEAREETGLEVKLENPEHPLCVKSHPRRDPRAHIISVAYVGRGSGRLRAGDDAANAALYSIPEVKALLGTGRIVFDHDDIIMEYLKSRGHEK